MKTTINNRLCTAQELNSIPHDKIEYIMMTNNFGFPTVTIAVDIAEDPDSDIWFNFPITNGFEVHAFNEFLRSLDLGKGFTDHVEFKSYKNYAHLLSFAVSLLQIKQLLDNVGTSYSPHKICTVLLDDYETFGFNALTKGIEEGKLAEYVQTAVQFLDMEAGAAQ